ncbi:MAG: hypothetical protein MMC23_006939 [Stictis urceolatum]|nr:hypothetical protein [Stictis urceolata]
MHLSSMIFAWAVAYYARASAMPAHHSLPRIDASELKDSPNLTTDTEVIYTGSMNDLRKIVQFVPGGVYLCPDAHWGGQCGYKNTANGQKNCYNVVDTLPSGGLSAIGPDSGAECQLYPVADCADDIEFLRVRFPGYDDLSTVPRVATGSGTWDNVGRSFACERDVEI